MPFVLHVTPDSVGNQRKAFVGSTKDVRGRTHYFEARGIEHREFLSTGRSDEEALAFLREADLSDCSAVLFEYETYIGAMAFLKAERPQVLRLVRAHNANLPHFLDNFTGELRMGDPGKALEAVETALDRFAQDRACARLADRLLAISEWEKRAYWDGLAGPAKVVNVPYYLPPMFPAERAAKGPRKLCVCFMGLNASLTPLLYDAGRNTVELVSALGDELADWEFVITGRLKPADVLGPLGRIEPVGLLASPLPLLAEARVVTILSDLGMGFKTKILEAIVAGCWVLVTPDLFDRLPGEVRPWCKPVAAGDVAGFRRALLDCEAPPPPGDPNEALRAQAFAGLDEAFAGRI